MLSLWCLWLRLRVVPGRSRWPAGFPGTTRSESGRARWLLPLAARTPPRSPSCPEFSCGAAVSPRDTAKAGNDRQQGEELHSSSMVSYPPKGINKFTFVNLRLLHSNRRGGIFLLAALLSTSSPPATARLLCSSRSGVTCHPGTPCAARPGFDSHPGGSMQQRHKRKEGEEQTAEPHKEHYLRSSRWRY